MWCIIFGGNLDQNPEKATLPTDLQPSIWGAGFKQNPEEVTVPSDLQSITVHGGLNEASRR